MLRPSATRRRSNVPDTSRAGMSSQTRRHRHPAPGQHLFGSVPGTDPSSRVRTQHKGDPLVGRKRLQGVEGVGGAIPGHLPCVGLEIGDPSGSEASHHQSMPRLGHLSAFLLPRRACREERHHVHPQLAVRRLTGHEMGHVRRVEGSAEDRPMHGGKHRGRPAAARKEAATRHGESTPNISATAPGRRSDRRSSPTGEPFRRGRYRPSPPRHRQRPGPPSTPQPSPRTRWTFVDPRHGRRSPSASLPPNRRT